MKKGEWTISIVITLILLAAFVFVMYPTITARTPSDSEAKNIRYTVGDDMSIVGVTFDVPAGANTAYVLYGNHSAPCVIEASRATCPIDFAVDGGSFEFVIR